MRQINPLPVELPLNALGSDLGLVGVAQQKMLVGVSEVLTGVAPGES